MGGGVNLRVVLAAVCLFAAPDSVAQTVRVGDDQVELVLELGPEGPRETGVRVNGALIGIEGAPWHAVVDGGERTPKQAAIAGGGDGSALRDRVEMAGTSDGLEWRLVYEVTGPGRISKSLTLNPQQDVLLERISLWNASSETAPRVASTSLQDIAAFYRFGENGLFVSLDFPYSRISTEDGAARVSYPPFARLKAGEAYATHSLTLGAVELTGTARYEHDDGEVAAMDAYVQERYEPRFQRPMYIYCGIINRYTQVTPRGVWYTYKDHPTLTFRPDIIKREMELMTRLGMEYYQMFPGPFDWVPGDPDPAVVQDVTDFARSLGVRPGTYSTTSGLFCFHYNDHQNTIDRPEWYMRDEQGNVVGIFCLGAADYVDYHLEVLTEACRKYGFELNCCDFLDIRPCFDTNHGHPTGADSVYHQVLGLVRMLDGINEVSPQMMTWSNAGNWAEFLPKLAWWNQNLYLTDPFIHTPWQGLNQTRLLDDARREQMVSLHHTRFIPYRFLTNFQYLLHQNSIVPDIRRYEFGALSTLAVAPNLGLGELRPWFEDLSPTNQERVTSFYTRWTDLLNENYDLFVKTYEAGERPGLGGVEIYGHAKGDRGYIFVVNPNYWHQAVEVPLDERLGFSGEGRCEVVEIYPLERLRLTPEGTTIALGSVLPVVARAQEVLVLEIRPASPVTEPTLYGLPGTVEKTSEGLQVKTRGPQGTTARFAVALPSGAEPVVSASVRKDVPKQPERDFHDTALEVLGRDDAGALFEVTFRRTPAPTELRDWRVLPGALDAGQEAQWINGLPEGEDVRLPLFEEVADLDVPSPVWGTTLSEHGFGPLAAFCGGYIENAFQEEQETWIEIETGAESSLPSVELAGEAPEFLRRPLPEAARSAESGWWLSTSFHLPFMYGIVSQPHRDEHTLLVLPFANPEKVKSIRAWINGAPLEVEQYRYPRNPGLLCHWADLVGSAARGGDNTLVLHIEFQE